jgi:hypothetical protein
MHEAPRASGQLGEGETSMQDRLAKPCVPAFRSDSMPTGTDSSASRDPVSWPTLNAVFQRLKAAAGGICRSPRHGDHAPSREVTDVTVVKFRDGEDGYLRWVERYPDGFVINCSRTPSPSYLMLHRASCRSISTPQRTNYTTSQYIKVCALDRRELELWATRDIGGPVTPCGRCGP